MSLDFPFGLFPAGYSERGETLEHQAFLGLRERRVGGAAAAAVDADRFHQNLERAPVVGERIDNEIDKPVRFRLQLSRRTEIVLRA